MRGTDKYLVIFAVGIVALVIIALVVASQQPDETYRDGDGPEDVAHNYLLALETGDYERAYSYLSSELEGYPPDVKSFVRQINQRSYQFPMLDNTTALTVLSTQEGDDWAQVDVRMTTSYGRGPFGVNRSTNELTLDLERVDDAWKIAGGERLFLYCWSAGDCY